MTLKQFKYIALLGIFLLVGCRFAEKEKFIVSDCETSNFIIVYNTISGQDRIENYGRTSYIVPDNGIILTNYPREKGVLNQKFVRRTEDGKLETIEDTSSCMYTGKLQTVLSINKDQLFPDQKYKNQTRYRYYSLIYSNGAKTENKDLSQFLEHTRNYLIKNKIKSKDSVVIKP